MHAHAHTHTHDWNPHLGRRPEINVLCQKPGGEEKETAKDRKGERGIVRKKERKKEKKKECKKESKGKKGLPSRGIVLLTLEVCSI